MGRIELTTRIAAPRELCFDLARSVELHTRSTARSGEVAVGGRTMGLLDPVTGSRVIRISEERIIVFTARSARAAVERAKRLGKQSELRYAGGLRLRFVGVLQLIELGVECAEGEVWWEFRRRRRAKERARTLVPAEKALYVFTDLSSKNNGQRAPSRARRKGAAYQAASVGGRG